MTEFRIVDVLTEAEGLGPKIVQAKNAEQAALLGLGLALVRSGARQDLRARVYYQNPDQPVNMVRLYGRVCDRVLKGDEHAR